MFRFIYFIKYLIFLTINLSYLYYRQIFLVIRALFSLKKAEAWLNNELYKDCIFIFTLHKILLGYTFKPYSFNKEFREKILSPMLYISNHQSLLDIMAFYAYFRYIPLRFVLKKSISRGFPYVSLVTRVQRQAAIIRKNPVQSINEVKRLAIASKYNKTSIVLFPEGTRSRDAKLLPFQMAAIRAILKIHPIPIAVVAVHNGYHFPTMWSISSLKPCIYPIKLLHIFPATNEKILINKNIDEAKRLITLQIKEWQNNIY